MAFTETLKVGIRRRAHFRCCVCRSVGVEIHHIVPQEDGGPDTEENAAPLCPSCHEVYGANPTKRKFLREARDFWYELCESQHSIGGLSLSELNAAIEPMATKRDIDEVKDQLARLFDAAKAKPDVSAHSDFVPVPLERYIRSLYEEDFGNRPSAYEFLFDSRAWYEHGEDSYDLLDRRAYFLKAYGEETAKRLCLIFARDAGFDPNGFTEEELGKVLNALHVAVVLITSHRSHAGSGEEGFECAIRSDGEFMWRTVDLKQAKQRTKTRSKRGKRMGQNTR